jgi:nucleoside-diphosphate-sugar epimerase
MKILVTGGAGFNLGSRYGIPTVALRYSIVQGPRQQDHGFKARA